MFSNASPFIRVVPVVFRKYVFSLRNVEKNRSPVNVDTGRVDKMVNNVNVFGKASALHSSMLFSAFVSLFDASSRESFLNHNVSSHLREITLNRFHKTFPRLEYFQFVE